jgi:hypothetical protein
MSKLSKIFFKLLKTDVNDHQDEIGGISHAEI